MITPPALHIALDTLRRDVHDMIPSAVESFDAVDRRSVVARVSMRVRDVVHLHRCVVRPTHRHPCLGVLRSLRGLLWGRGSASLRSAVGCFSAGIHRQR